MKRHNGNRYNRKRAHQVRNNIIYNSYQDRDWNNHKRFRQQARQQLHHTSYDDDWDVVTDSPKMIRWGRCAPHVRCRQHYRDDRVDPKLKNVTTEDIKHLPQWAQHRWHQNVANENNTHYCSFNCSNNYISYSFEKTLVALKLACRDPDKIWALEHAKIRRVNAWSLPNYEYTTRVSIPLSDLRDWLHMQWECGFSHTPRSDRYDENGNYLYTIEYNRIEGMGKHICTTLRDLGYDVYKD